MCSDDGNTFNKLELRRTKPVFISFRSPSLLASSAFGKNGGGLRLRPTNISTAIHVRAERVEGRGMNRKIAKWKSFAESKHREWSLRLNTGIGEQPSVSLIKRFPFDK